MELSLITPTAFLQWSKLLPGRFCLAHIAARSLRYLNFFAGESNVVLDNGAFEGELVSAELLIETALKVRPTVLVAPDILNGNSSKNLECALDFANGPFKASGLKCELMFVPQCRTGRTLMFGSSIQHALASGKFQWLGINRNAVYNAFGKYTQTTDENLNKFYFGVWAQQTGIIQEAREHEVKFHLLGVGDNIGMLRHFWWVERADLASLFFQATFSNKVSEDGHLDGAIKRPSGYFEDEGTCLDRGWEDALRHNCKEALKYASEAGRARDQVLKGRI